MAVPRVRIPLGAYRSSHYGECSQKALAGQRSRGILLNISQLGSGLWDWRKRGLCRRVAGFACCRAGYGTDHSDIGRVFEHDWVVGGFGARRGFAPYGGNSHEGA